MTERAFQIRIVGHGEEAPDQLVANPRNWRVHPAAQQEALVGSLSEIGWIQEIIVNQNTGYVLDGHARVAIALRNNEPTVPVAYVDLSDAEEALALATFDPISAMATVNTDVLNALIAEIQIDNAALNDLLASLSDSAIAITPDDDSDGAAYSRAVESPVYEITGERPSIDDLVDESRVSMLLATIDDSNAPDDVKRFLRLAAMRRLKFDYGRVAEFYAHASADVQDLMEQSALVIIDVDRAIELGFAKLADDLRGIAAEAGDDDDA